MELERLVCPLVHVHPKMVLKYASIPKALPLTGWSQKAQSLSPIFSLQPQHSRWQVARDTMRDLGRHLLETDGTLRLYNIAVIIFG